MTPSDFECCIAAERSWRASGGDKMVAEAILFVWRNRAKESGRSWTEVVYDRYYDGSDPDPKQPDFQYILQVVDLIYNNQRRDRLTGSANRFGSSLDVPLGINPTAHVGNLFFWREG